MSSLLIPQPPLQVLPALAKAIGLNEAIFLQQLHYWLTRSKNEHDGRRWIYNTFEEWQAQFPFWSLRTMKRIAASLLEQDLIIIRKFKATDWDRRNWYSIKYDSVEEMDIQLQTLIKPHSAKLARSVVTDWHDLESANLARSSTENTHKTTKPDFISRLKENPAYQHIDIDREVNKMKAWLELPANKNRQLTSRFALNWLNKIEPPLQINTNGHSSKLTTSADLKRMLGE